MSTYEDWNQWIIDYHNLTNDLIFDRTQTDIDNKTQKAYYNKDDLSRIEKWIFHTARVLEAYGYVSDYTTITGGSTYKVWNRNEFANSSALETIRQKLIMIKNAYYSSVEIPNNLEYMTFLKANKLEEFLYKIYIYIYNMEKDMKFSGDIYSGEV